MYVVKLEGKESRMFESRDEALALAFELKRVFNDLKVEVIKDESSWNGYIRLNVWTF